jgi:hypothetical protein
MNNLDKYNKKYLKYKKKYLKLKNEYYGGYRSSSFAYLERTNNSTKNVLATDKGTNITSNYILFLFNKQDLIALNNGIQLPADNFLFNSSELKTNNINGAYIQTILNSINNKFIIELVDRNNKIINNNILRLCLKSVYRYYDPTYLITLNNHKEILNLDLDNSQNPAFQNITKYINNIKAMIRDNISINNKTQTRNIVRKASNPLYCNDIFTNEFISDIYNMLNKNKSVNSEFNQTILSILQNLNKAILNFYCNNILYNIQKQSMNISTYDSGKNIKLDFKIT